MKKELYSSVLLLILGTSLYAQSFNTSNFEKKLPCKILTKSGKTKEVVAKYNHPNVLKDPGKPLETYVDDSPVSVDKRSLETFYIDGQCWVERSTPAGRQWVRMTRQGPIEHIIFLKSGADLTTDEYISKSGQVESPASMALSYKKKMSQLVNDYPELAKKVSNGEKGYGLLNYLSVVDEYNAWFRKTNPDAMKYYPWFESGKVVDPYDVGQRIKQSKDSVITANKALDSSRPSTPPPGIASKKPNVPPRKESFSAKVKRYEAEGHKIAVVMEEQKIKLLATKSAINVNPKDVGFDDNPEMALIDTEIYKQTINDLNKVYNTTIFEAVQLEQIPVDIVKSTPVDNWWSTCYKTVVFLSHLKQFSCSNDMMTAGDYEGTASIGLYANVFEYIDDDKKSKDAVKRMYVLANGVSDEFKYTEKDWPISFEKLESMVDWKKVNERYAKKQQDQWAKLVEKWD